MTSQFLFLSMEKLSGYLSVSAAVVLVYDYCLTLPLEVKLIWHSKWSYTKVLFLLTRYLPIVNMLCVLMYVFSGINTYGPNHAGVILQILAAWIMVVNITLAESIFAIRTWAIWHRNWKVGIILTVSVLGAFSTLVYFTVVEIIFNLSYINLLPFPGATQTFASPMVTEIPFYIMIRFGGLNFGMHYLALAGLQFVVLVPLAISALNAYRSGNATELSNLIHRDGILCYVFLFCTTMTYAFVQFYELLCIYSVTSQQLEVVMYSVLTGRVILNIRASVGRQRMTDTDLHTTYLEMDVGHKETMSLRFAARDECSEGYGTGKEDHV